MTAPSPRSNHLLILTAPTRRLRLQHVWQVFWCGELSQHPVSESWLLHFPSNALLMHLARQQRLLQGPGSLIPMWETGMEFCSSVA